MPTPNCSLCRHRLLLSALMLLSAGCIVFPVRMPPQIQGRSGVSADHGFMVEGRTGRQEVLQQLGWADVGLNENRIFWSRWLASSSGTVVIMVVPGALGGERNRNWGIHNSLVEFDENGVVVRVAKDVKDKDVIRELLNWSQRSGYRPANLSPNSFAASTEGWHRHDGSMVVNADSLEFFEGRSMSQTRFKVPRDQIVSLKLKSKAGAQPSYTIKLKEKTPWGNEIDLAISPSQLLPLLPRIVTKNP